MDADPVEVEVNAADAHSQVTVHALPAHDGDVDVIVGARDRAGSAAREATREAVTVEQTQAAQVDVSSTVDPHGAHDSVTTTHDDHASGAHDEHAAGSDHDEHTDTDHAADGSDATDATHVDAAPADAHADTHTDAPAHDDATDATHPHE